MESIMNGMEKFHRLGLQPNVERYMRDNNRQTIGKLGFAGFGKKWIMQSWVCRSKVQGYARNEQT